MKKLAIFRFAPLLLFSIFVSLTWAESGGEGVNSYKNIGTIDEVYANKERVLVDDREYSLALNVRVYTASGRLVNRYYLKKGQQVSLTTTSIPNSRVLSVIKVLKPSNQSY